MAPRPPSSIFGLTAWHIRICADHVHLKKSACCGCVQLAEPHGVRLVKAPGCIDEDVKSTVALDDVGDESVYRALIRDVEAAGVSLPALRFDCSHDLVRPGARGAVAHRHRGSLRAEG